MTIWIFLYHKYESRGGTDVFYMNGVVEINGASDQSHGFLNALSRQFKYRPNLWFGIVVLLSAFPCVVYLTIFMRVHSPSEVFVFFTEILFCYFIAGYSYYFFHLSRRDSIYGEARLQPFLRTVAISAAIAIILEGATVFGSLSGHIFQLNDWSKKRAIIFIIVSYSFQLFVLSHRKEKLTVRVRSALSSINLHDVFTQIIRLSIIAGLAFVLALFMIRAVNIRLLPCWIFVFIVMICVYAVLFTKCIVRKPEWCFLIIALLCGGFICIYEPPMTGISWDDQIHYLNSVKASYILAPEYADQDYRFQEIAVLRATGKETSVGLSTWPTDRVEKNRKSMDTAFQSDIASRNITQEKSNSSVFTLSTMGYVPSAIGLWLGRLLRLPFSSIVVLGRLTNLISYCSICFLAIRTIPTKKIVFALVALIPNCLFLAANYSYDPWVISFLLLGTALAIREMWSTEKITFSRLVLPAVILFLGLCVKAVYFPIIGLFFLMPKEKFQNHKQRVRFYAAVTVFGIFVLMTFALPFLFTVHTDLGDLRGGVDVNPSEQLKFIIQNPISYGLILLRFLFSDLFNPLAVGGSAFSFAYLGALDFGGSLSAAPSQIESDLHTLIKLLPFFFLILAAVISSDETSRSQSSILKSAWSFFTFFASFVLVATALYVSFTPVRSETINGVQSRYLLPWMGPGLATIVNVKSPITMNNTLAKLYILCSALAVLACVWSLVALRLVYI